jgi:predicted RNA-binding protein YlqC (UPF0109 family)
MTALAAGRAVSDSPLPQAFHFTVRMHIMTEPSGDVRVLVELIAKSLVDTPDEVFVEKFDYEVIELEVAESDVGKVIGRQGRTARALRALLSAAGHRAHKRYTLEIIE